VTKVSTIDADPDSATRWARDHALADDYLARSGLAWTRLQPGAFMKNLLTEAPVIKRGWLPQTTGYGATGWIDAGDVLPRGGRDRLRAARTPGAVPAPAGTTVRAAPARRSPGVDGAGPAPPVRRRRPTRPRQRPSTADTAPTFSLAHRSAGLTTSPPTPRTPALTLTRRWSSPPTPTRGRRGPPPPSAPPAPSAQAGTSPTCSLN